MTINVKLEDNHFSELVRGEVVRVKDAKGTVVTVQLSDIGYDDMLRLIWYAMSLQEKSE